MDQITDPSAEIVRLQRELEAKTHDLGVCEDRLRLALKGADAGLWDWDVTTGVMFWSDELYEVIGLPPDTPPSYPSWLASVREEDRERADREALDALDRKDAFSIEFRVDHPLRGRRWIASRGRTIHDPDGRPLRMIGIALDVTDRKQVEAASRDREEWLWRFAESDIIGINFADIHGGIKHANDAYLRLIGYSREDLLAGRVRWTEVTPPEWLYTDKRAIAEAKQRGTCTPYEKEYVRRDGSRVPVLVGFVLPDKDRDDAVAFILDLTERKRAEREAQAAKEVAEAATRAKDTFLAALSHELRMPLTPVLMTLTALNSDPKVPSELRDEVKMIRRNLEMEARLIDDLLDLTKITHGKISLELETVDAHAEIRHAIHTCRGDLDGKRLKLDEQLRAGRRCVRADSGRFQQVVWNLVKNAAKFTPEGGTVTVATEDTGGDRLRIRVCDTGIGIAADVLPHIFDAFEQGGIETTRRYGGLGLGLSITKAIVDAHGGTLVASSRGKGMGATFTVELGGASFPAGEREESRESKPVRERRALRILLVEDHQETARVMARILAGVGHAVTTADSVAAAISKAEQAGFDLVISDLGLPDGSGLELMRGLRPLPGIALTGYGLEADVKKAREAGFLAHLTKPIDARRLEAILDEVALDI
jgi:PAS domain S-box-containing protein